MTQKKHTKKFLTKLGCFTLMLSAICHDVDHTGHNNDFEIKSKSELALRYHDLSVIHILFYKYFLAS